ncbi:MAG: quinolinate synthase NadA, partial [Candidatus Marinimicrobia bacterium]|nr:quinolinate synthase NadA [Candidatus Neomarinimicrobiota bacterium]
AGSTDADVIVFCGVHFMAETAKIVNPGLTVLLPDLEAVCSLADSCPPDAFGKFVKEHPGHTVITYINTTATVKALSDIICTSSNAVQVVAGIPEDQPIIFSPDRHLGNYVMRQTGRDMLLWDGSCIVHEIFSEQEILRLKDENPGALVLAHPECEANILRHADHIGSTTSIIKFATTDDHEKFIIATEEGVLHQMQKLAPHKTYIPAPTTTGCACSQCPYMRKITVEKVYLSLRDMQPVIEIDEQLRKQALKPIEKMLAL